MNMKTLFLMLLFRVSLQLQCEKKQITAHLGGGFRLFCTYDAKHYLFSKKYWCRGKSRVTCEIVLDSEGLAKSAIKHRSRFIDVGRRGLYIEVTNLQYDDAGVYWVGIDKINADIMTSVIVNVTQVPVSKPRLRPSVSLASRSTCWGQPVVVHCNCDKGTNIRYSWFYKEALIHHSTDLMLYCGAVEKDSSDYYCVASNDVSIQRSDVLAVQLIVPADKDCIYVIRMQGQPVYNCADRMTTTTIPTSTPSLTTTCPATLTIHSEPRNQSESFSPIDQEHLFCRALMGHPLWYTLLRWVIFTSLLIFLSTFHICIKFRQNHASRRRRARFRHLAR